MQDGLSAPHGGTLVNRILRGDELADARARAPHLPGVELDAWTRSDLELIATGVVSPLDGFMDSAAHRAVVEHMHLPGGLPWTLPLVLPAPAEVAAGLRPGARVALTHGGSAVGLLELREVFQPDREWEARRVYRTTDPRHPGVRRLLERAPACLAGPVWLLERARPDFPELAFDPAQTRQEFAGRGWRRVVGFQTRNPVHRAHEYIQKVALETGDGLFLNPLLGQTKEDDVPAPLRVQAYQVLLAEYFPAGRVFLGAFPAAMRYGGPREAVFHALCRKNYGCSHFIVGRDHAGVGNYYGPLDAQRIFSEFDPGALGITPLFFEHTFYCRRCAGMASEKTCPHPAADRVVLSGSRVREMLRSGQLPPPEFTRPEVARVLAAGLGAPAAD